jgi:hypothetical protein
MKSKLWLPVLLLVTAITHGAELRISSTEPVTVTVPDQWQSKIEKSPGKSFPFETYRISPPGGRNAACLISLLAKDKPEFNNPQVLQKVVRGDSRPYVHSADELSKINVKEISLNDGVGYYANFIDPDLAGKPVKKGDYKTATPVILSLGKKYLIKVTILCDQIDGPDYGDVIRIVRSLKIKAHRE